MRCNWEFPVLHLEGWKALCGLLKPTPMGKLNPVPREFLRGSSMGGLESSVDGFVWATGFLVIKHFPYSIHIDHVFATLAILLHFVEGLYRRNSALLCVHLGWCIKSFIRFLRIGSPNLG